MRIALVSTYGVKCGIATYTEHLAREITGDNDVVIFAEDCINNGQQNFNTDLKFVRCFNRNSKDTRLIEALRNFKPDVVHIQHEYGIFKDLTDLLEKVRHNFRGRTVMTLHTVNVANGFDLHNCSDYFIVHKELAKTHLEMTEKVKPEFLRMIPHGTLIVPHKPAEFARKKLGLPVDSKIVLSHAFFERRKNIDKIIKAVSDLKSETPIYYIHIGDIHPHISEKNGEIYYRECLRLIKELDIERHVRFLRSFVPDEELFYYLNACDVIVTLENENYPKISASGIMHTVAGKPVIASNVTNFTEFPDNSFYKIDINVESLKDAIREILSNPELSEELVRNLLQYARETSWDKVAKEHLKLYTKCIEKATLRYIYT
ncbi:MAG TPA: glycosyltransferase [Archaeoglobaceae archaeon]|nr:glycosyltransferase [Archaeoglobaceae archaeon]